MDHYNLKTYIRPYWKSSVVENESVFPIGTKDNSPNIVPLMYKADKILEVRSSWLDTLYEEGKDYKLENECLRIMEDGNITCLPYDKYMFPDKGEDGKCFECSEGGYIFFSECSTIHDMQIAVTYTHNDTWNGPVPEDKSGLLPNTTKKLKNGQKLSILIFGDSISTGANSSKVVGAKPYADAWYDMLCEYLRKKYPECNISMSNTSVGGTSSPWGLETVQENAVKYHPDLLILGFGMNDGSGRRTADDFGNNISEIMKAVSVENPDCEFILISTMLPHKLVKGFYGLQEEYLPVLKAMEKEGTAVADVTSVHKYILEHKRYFDMTGNNVNHPNDFLARLYAQILIKTLGSEE